MSHTLANDASFYVIHVYRPHAMPLASKSHGFKLPRVIQQATALEMTRIYLESVGSLLLVASVDIIGFSLAGSREFLAVRVRTLFS